jgi:hypothetical protein
VQERVSHFAHELQAYLISGAKLGLGRDRVVAPAAAGVKPIPMQPK